jgi:hypothetical protein
VAVPEFAADHCLQQTPPQKGGGTVTAARAMAIGLTDFSFFALPPDRPSRSERRSRGDIVTSLLRTIGNELARAMQTPATNWMPRISNYPY